MFPKAGVFRKGATTSLCLTQKGFFPYKGKVSSYILGSQLDLIVQVPENSLENSTPFSLLALHATKFDGNYTYAS